MHHPRVLAGAAGGTAVLAAVAIALGSAGPARTSPQHWPPPGAHDNDTSRMLREIDPRRLRAYDLKLVGFGTRNTLSSQTDPNRGIGAARDWIKSQFDEIAATSGGRMTVALDSYVQPPASRIPVPTTITNVVATLKGDQPESTGRTYVVSGHYDSMCGSPTNATCDAPGANDDASGVIAILEMARVMAKRHFDATIVFMAVAGEEQGLYGSDHYAKTAKAAGMDIQGMFTNDIIGASRSYSSGISRPRVVRLFAEGVPTAETPQQASTRQSVGGENDSPSRQLARFVEEVAENRDTKMDVQVIYRRDRYLRGGDHISFLQQGYPAARFTEPDETYEHQHQDVRVENGIQYGDLPEFVDFDFVARVARVNASALTALARGPQAPKNTRIITANLTNDTQLRWNANPEPDLAGYEIVWRFTDEPKWTHTIPVGNVTDYTIKNMSKDNFFFGVRAIDKEGHRSPVSFPVPASR
jgi:Peptidase family M28